MNLHADTTLAKLARTAIIGLGAVGSAVVMGLLGILGS